VPSLVAVATPATAPDERGRGIIDVVESPVLADPDWAERGRRSYSPSGDAAGPPVVRVTIGRIEVKAAHPESPPRDVAPLPEATAPRLSLDDYLERRKATWK
jgi:hypothetical protein